jgi:hypothetical protein
MIYMNQPSCPPFITLTILSTVHKFWNWNILPVIFSNSSLLTSLCWLRTFFSALVQVGSTVILFYEITFSTLPAPTCQLSAIACPTHAWLTFNHTHGNTKRRNSIMKVWRFSHWCNWGFWSSGIWHCVSRVRSTRPLTMKPVCSFWDIGSHLSNDAASHLKD